MRLAIIGSGIGGLTAALALRKHGHAVTLIERESAFRPAGAGIILSPNSLCLLEALGLAVSSIGLPLPSLDITDASGRLLQRSIPDAALGPIFSFARTALHDALVRAVPSDVSLALATSYSSHTETAEGIFVSTEAGQQFGPFDFLIGADGLRSRVRTQLLGDLPLRYSGTTCWRGLVPNPGYDRAIETWGKQVRMGLVPLAGGQLYYYLVASAEANAPAPTWPEAFCQRFAGFAPAYSLFLDTLTTPPPLHHDLLELHEPVWGSDRVLLLGDAAHAMTPNLGQGAGMAMEDAIALSHAITTAPTNALARYRGLRQKRVRRVQLTSRQLGELAHTRNPLVETLRNFALRAMPARLASAQFNSLLRPGLALRSLV